MFVSRRQNFSSTYVIIIKIINCIYKYDSNSLKYFNTVYTLSKIFT